MPSNAQQKSARGRGPPLPQLRAVAARIKKESPKGVMPDLPQGDMFEEKLLRGFVIASADLPFEEHLKAAADFVPEIDNWSVCDSFVNSLKFFKKDRERVWEFLQPYFDSDKPYDIRFAVVAALDYFSDDEYAARAFGKFDAITNDDYYVKMRSHGRSPCSSSMRRKRHGSISKIIVSTISLSTSRFRR